MFQRLDISCAEQTVCHSMASEIAHTGHQCANAILRCFARPDTALLVRAFVSYVRPQRDIAVTTFDA